MLWITISQQEELIQENLDSNVRQLENEIDVATNNFEKTLRENINNSDFTSLAGSLFKIKGDIPGLKRVLQCEAITELQKLMVNKGYERVALYNVNHIESYASREQVFIHENDPSGKIGIFLHPSANFKLNRCRSKEWIGVKEPTELDLNINIPSDITLKFNSENGRLNLQGYLPILDTRFQGGEEKVSKIGAIYLEEHFSNDFMLDFSNKTLFKNDLFSLDGKHLVGVHAGKINTLFPDILERLTDRLFTEINFENEAYFMVIKTYFHNGQPAFLMASYSPKKKMVENIKELFFLQLSSLIIGLVLAAVVAFFMEKIIINPIRDITDQMKDIAAGKKIDKRVRVKSRDELGKLAQSFNQMTSILEERDREVSRFVYELDKTNQSLEEERENLEVAVSERTHELELAKEEAETANRAKTVFLSRMSHELRTPLNAILGFSQLMMLNNESLTAIQKGNVKQILNGGNHLLKLVNDVLDLSRVESGVLEVNIGNVSLQEVLNEAILLARPLAEEHGIKLINDMLTEGDLFVLADRMRLIQIILNLLTNAIKYNKDSGTVDVVCEKITHDKVRIHVRDTGMGIPEDRKNELFEPFKRLGRDNIKIDGAGIGLSITKELVEQMNGSISAESLSGEGSCFTIELPLGENHIINEQGTGNDHTGQISAEINRQPIKESDGPISNLLYSDYSKVKLSKEFLFQLKEAAELNKITRVEIFLNQLIEMGGNEEKLGNLLMQSLNVHEMKKILAILNQVSHDKR